MRRIARTPTRMTADVASGVCDTDHARCGKTFQMAAAALLLLALVARVAYAYGLPTNGDEHDHLQIAREISLRPAVFHFPLDSPATGHPLGVVYLTALGNWLGGGSLLVIRLIFVLLSLVGLVGLLVLATSLFGPRVALIALTLAAVDRSLVASASVFLESPSVACLAPWIMLLMYRCVERGSRRDWLLVGLLFGVGYWLSTLILGFLLPFGLYIVARGKLKEVLRCRRMYEGLAVMLAVMAPAILPELSREWGNYERNVSKLGAIGWSPRMGLLYVGDLLICLKETTWIVENNGHKMYMPIYVPCDWVAGLIYVAGVGLSLRFYRDRRTALFLLLIVGFLIPVTLIDAREPWNSTPTIELYQRAIQLAPDLGPAHWRLGALLARQNRFEEAKEHLKTAERLGYKAPFTHDNMPTDSSPQSEVP